MHQKNDKKRLCDSSINPTYYEIDDLIFDAASYPDIFESYEGQDNVELPEPVDLIKVDIEGHELAFLEGARKTIARDRPFIFPEVLPSNSHTTAGLTKFTQQMGYLDFALRKEVAILSELVEHDPLAWNHAFVPCRSFFKVIILDCLTKSLLGEVEKQFLRGVRERKAVGR